jgi:hypothetical protein
MPLSAPRAIHPPFGARRLHAASLFHFIIQRKGGMGVDKMQPEPHDALINQKRHFCHRDAETQRKSQSFSNILKSGMVKRN